MTDRLWTRPAAPAHEGRVVEEPTTIAEVAAWWRAVAARERDPRLAASYRQTAASLEKYLALKEGRSC